ncbi:6-phosphogluconate dehydrogenase (decarboxylating) [Candidatus Heimdallarchaeota archaeon B3_Heim]|nr:MAG: 6-phosphogluconate dehydrogenase (decarboxylating) [Candidatus Heimdallarchaeota archaeon B3_Heim]
MVELIIIGLGKMGGNLAQQAVDKGITVYGKARSQKPELEKYGVHVFLDYKSLFNELSKPRVVYLSLPAGKIIDQVISEITPFLEEGDVILDGGNSFYQDSIRRESELEAKGIYFCDTGTSGGWEGARYGACFMVGGKKEGVQIAEPILKKLAVENGYVHTGAPGTGHFVKLVHNGIEFGMLQAIGEGVSLLTASGFKLDLQKIFLNWSNGSVIRSWLVELMEKGLREKKLSDIESYIEDTGEVNWLVQDAINKEIPTPVISISITELMRAREMSDSDTYRAIAMMRHGFGGHPFGKSDYISNERKTSRLAPL